MAGSTRTDDAGDVAVRRDFLDERRSLRLSVLAKSPKMDESPHSLTGFTNRYYLQIEGTQPGPVPRTARF